MSVPGKPIVLPEVKLIPSLTAQMIIDTDSDDDNDTRMTRASNSSSDEELISKDEMEYSDDELNDDNVEGEKAKVKELIIKYVSRDEFYSGQGEFQQKNPFDLIYACVEALDSRFDSDLESYTFIRNILSDPQFEKELQAHENITLEANISQVLDQLISATKASENQNQSPAMDVDETNVRFLNYDNLKECWKLNKSGKKNLSIIQKPINTSDFATMITNYDLQILKENNLKCFKHDSKDTKLIIVNNSQEDFKIYVYVEKLQNFEIIQARHYIEIPEGLSFEILPYQDKEKNATLQNIVQILKRREATVTAGDCAENKINYAENASNLKRKKTTSQTTPDASIDTFTKAMRQKWIRAEQNYENCKQKFKDGVGECVWTFANENELKITAEKKDNLGKPLYQWSANLDNPNNKRNDKDMSFLVSSLQDFITESEGGEWELKHFYYVENDVERNKREKNSKSDKKNRKFPAYELMFYFLYIADSLQKNVRLEATKNKIRASAYYQRFGFKLTARGGPDTNSKFERKFCGQNHFGKIKDQMQNKLKANSKFFQFEQATNRSRNKQCYYYVDGFTKAYILEMSKVLKKMKVNDRIPIAYPKPIPRNNEDCFNEENQIWLYEDEDFLNPTDCVVNEKNIKDNTVKSALKFKYDTATKSFKANRGFTESDEKVLLTKRAKKKQISRDQAEDRNPSQSGNDDPQKGEEDKEDETSSDIEMTQSTDDSNSPAMEVDDDENNEDDAIMTAAKKTNNVFLSSSDDDDDDDDDDDEQNPTVRMTTDDNVDDDDDVDDVMKENEEEASMPDKEDIRKKINAIIQNGPFLTAQEIDELCKLTAQLHKKI